MDVLLMLFLNNSDSILINFGGVCLFSRSAFVFEDMDFEGTSKRTPVSLPAGGSKGDRLRWMRGERCG